MISLFDVLPEVAHHETRSALIGFESTDDDDIPHGAYHFTEFYCPDMSCHCSRVIIKVVRTDLDGGGEGVVVATFGYTWDENNDFNLLFGPSENPYLDPLHDQSLHAQELLDLWCSTCLSDRRYVDRLKRHSREFRKEIQRQLDLRQGPAYEALSGIMQFRQPSPDRAAPPRPLGRKERHQRAKERRRFFESRRSKLANR